MTELKEVRAMDDFRERDYPYSYAGFFLRLVAFLIDMMVVYALFNIIKVFVPFDIKASVFSFTIEEILKTLLTLAYFSLMTFFTGGRTLGKMLLGLRVISLSSDKLSFSQVVLREVCGRYVQNKFKLIYIIVGISPKKQSLFDILLDTTVVKEDLFRHLYEK
ncbi:RDD family protein [Anaerococcus tetradius]|jgi:hypothetical protein|uniref:RDD family protein n=1 Tax=Anaerococcus tetradius TaxID=33036 RepID=UPI0023F40634|nr:RDD family protein [Anaerococcus tetradius]